MILALSRIELTLLLRNKTAVGMAVAIPLLLGGYLAVNQPGDWTMVITLQLVLTLSCTGYLTTTTSLVARRQDLYLKRLRTGQAGDSTVFVGLLLPTVLLGCAQTVALLAVSLVAGAPLPQHPLLLLLAVLGGFAMACAAGVFTSAITGSVELAQITTFPFFLALLAGAIFGLEPAANGWLLVVPGTSVAELIHAAWGGSTSQVLPSMAALAAWTAAGALLSVRHFRWEPRV